MNATALEVPHDPAAEAAFRATQRERLRALLLTREVFTTQDLVERVGSRFGGRLKDLRDGVGGRPMVISRTRLTSTGSSWAYRFERYAESAPSPEPRRTLRELKRECALLRRALVEAGVELPAEVVP